mgnify:CR=1 FL=1
MDKFGVTTTTTNPITARFTADNGTILLFTLRDDNKLLADIYMNGDWKGQKVIASWNNLSNTNATYTAESGVNVRSATYTHIGHIVIFSIQLDLPAASPSATLVTFKNIPTPIKGENYFVVGNGDSSRSLILTNGKLLKSGGAITTKSWASGTLVYATNEFI